MGGSESGRRKCSEYVGQVNVSRSGNPCKTWDGHQHSPSDGTDHNYCRGLDGKYPWCYTGENENAWEYCRVPKCHSTAIIKEAEVPLIGRRDCLWRTNYQSLNMGTTWSGRAYPKNWLSENMMCAGYLEGGVDSCQGDSGGPLLCQDPTTDQFYVWGITSWGEDCALKGYPGLYTVVANFKEWIEDTMKYN